MGRNRDTSIRAVGFVPTDQKKKGRCPGRSVGSPDDSVGFSDPQKEKMYGVESLYIIDFAIQAGVQWCRVISWDVYDSVGGSDPQGTKNNGVDSLWVSQCVAVYCSVSLSNLMIRITRISICTTPEPDTTP